MNKLNFLLIVCCNLPLSKLATAESIRCESNPLRVAAHKGSKNSLEIRQIGNSDIYELRAKISGRAEPITAKLHCNNKEANASGIMFRQEYFQGRERGPFCEIEKTSSPLVRVYYGSNWTNYGSVFDGPYLFNLIGIPGTYDGVNVPNVTLKFDANECRYLEPKRGIFSKKTKRKSEGVSQ